MRYLVAVAILLLQFSSHAQQSNYFNDSLYIIQRDVKITLKDGVRLNAYVIRYKEDTAPMPVILMINCYPSVDGWRTVQRYLRRGMAAVLVYNRGKEKSEGIFEPFERDAEDNYDVIDWISKQSWCNGSIGMYGGSYLGFATWAACKKMHPALKTIVPLVAVAPGIDYPMHNNVFMSYMLRWINYTTNNKMADGANFNNEQYWNTLYKNQFSNGLSFTRLDSLDGSPDIIFQRWLKHPNYDDYWSSMIPYTPEEYSRIDIPILTVTGYFDADQRGAMYYYNMHNRYGPKEAVKNHYLLIGPWDHSGAQTFPQRTIGTYKVDKDALVPVLPIVMDWFDHVLRGKSRPKMLKDRVNYFVMDGAWKHSASLETMNSDTMNLFLSPAMGNWHKLSLKANDSKESLTWTFEFGNDLARGNAEENDPLDEHFLQAKDQLVFDSEPLQHDVEISGTPIADLFMNINKLDMDLYLSIYEVSPGGKTFQLSKTLQRLSYISSREKRTLIEPGEINRYIFTNSYFTAKKIKKGSVIRFVLKPMNSPGWQKNYGTGKDVSEETGSDASPVIIQLLTGGKYKSNLLIPFTILSN
jgi:uncharacterized protein